MTVATSEPPQTKASRQSPSERRAFIWLLAAVGLGAAVGLFFGESVAPLRIVSEGFIRLLQVTVVPYVLGSILAGLGSRSLAEARALAVRGGIVLLMFWVTGLALVVAGSLAYPGRAAGDTFFSETPPPAPVDWLALYIPSNPFSSLANNVLPAIVLFGLLGGAALCTMEGTRKQTLLDTLEAFNEAMGRIARATVRITPIGLFAIMATTIGLMRPEQLVRLQLWFVVYIGTACIVSFWVLPSLVGLVTPISAQSFARRLRAPLLTAFAAGDLFIVLPIIAEECKELLREQGVSQADSDSTIGVIVPLMFNFPHTGKVLSLGFIPFAAWFGGDHLSLTQWGTMASAGILTLFGSVNSAIPFLLDLFHLPADMFGLFTMSGLLNSRFGALLAATHTASISLVIAAALLHRVSFQPRRLFRFAIGTTVIVAVFVIGTRVVFGRLLPPPAQGLEALAGFNLRFPAESGILVGRPTIPDTPPVPGRRLSEIRARSVLRVGYIPDSVPYAFFNASGELLGYDVEMAHTLARDLGVSLELVEVTRGDAPAALTSGGCDIIMTGLFVSLERATRMALSHPYDQERIGFLVEDEDRALFSSLAALSRERMTIGMPAIDDIAPLIRRAMTGSTFVPYPTIDALVGSVSHTTRAAVMPIDRAFYMSRIHPEFSAVVPEEPTSSVALAYALPAGELEFRNVVDTWIDVKRAQGAFESAKAYWVHGEGLVQRSPRWSIARNVLGWLR